jgi:large subunit ribosomal protein L16
MLMPKKTKFRKVQKGTLKGRSKGAREVFFGDYGLQAIEPFRVTSQQIEALRVTLTRKLKKDGHMFLRIFPDKPVTKKPAETRMGKGKGNPEVWVAPVKRGRVIVEVSGFTEQEAREALRSASYKLPLKTKFVRKNESAPVQ